MMDCLAPTPVSSPNRDVAETCVITPHSDRAAQLGRPLRTAFVLSSMQVGGAETLLVNMIRRFRPDRIAPSVVCTKEPGPLGDLLAVDFPVSSGWLRNKYDLSVISRLASFFKKERIDAVVTVGAGDKMFWGRLAAAFARVPVICSSLHSTGWPDGVGRLNRLLTPLTDRFIAVAKAHGSFLVQWERFPESKVAVIHNGVDTDVFRPDVASRISVRKELGLPVTANLVGIVAALRPEKNHEHFVQVAHQIALRNSAAYFLIIGDGPERVHLERQINQLSLQNRVFMLGSRSDIARLVTSLDVFALTSFNEACPVSILEAMSCGIPVVATRVGSVSESVLDDWNGFTVEPDDTDTMVRKISSLLDSSDLAITFGSNGRDHAISRFSIDSMVKGYEELIASIYCNKFGKSFPPIPR
jgi:glycosyltransferase involved in cell wall biosynthesis